LRRHSVSPKCFANAIVFDLRNNGGGDGEMVEKLEAYPQLGWISALRSGSIRKLVEDKELQLSLFDK